MGLNVLIFLILFVLHQVLGCSSDANPNANVSMTSIQSACLVSDSNNEEFSFTEVSIEQVGDSIEIMDFIVGNCCLEYSLAISVNENMLEIQEIVGAGELCRCSCDYSLIGTINGLNPGEYQVEVYSHDSTNISPKYSGTLLVE